MKELEIVKQIIEELNKTNSQNEKIEILKKYWSNETFKKVLYYTFNTFLQYHVTSENCKKKSNLTHPDYTDNLFSLLTDLNECNITGHSAIAAVNGFVEKNREVEDLIWNIIDRNLKCRIDSSIINKIEKDFIPTFSVVLANVYEDYEEKIDFSKEEWFISRKLDGLRCLVVFNELGEPRCFSRTGKEFHTLEKLKEELRRLGLKDIVFDGEICIVDEDGKENFTQILTEYKKKNYTISNPKYLVFDILTKEEFIEKSSKTTLFQRLQRIGILFDNFSKVTLLTQNIVPSKQMLISVREQASIAGWEGLMLRKNTVYEGKRTKNLLKVKFFKDAEYTVCGIEVGDFRVINKETGLEETIQTMTNVLIEHKGNIVSVGSGFSLEERKRYYTNPELIKGKIITVKYFEETVDSKTGKFSLRFPTVKAIYEERRDV